MHHLFIYLFICWSNRMVALLLCYHFTALYTYKVISVLVLFVIFRGLVQLIGVQVGLNRLPPAALVAYPIARQCSQRIGDSGVHSGAYFPRFFLVSRRKKTVVRALVKINFVIYKYTKFKLFFLRRLYLYQMNGKKSEL